MAASNVELKEAGTPVAHSISTVQWMQFGFMTPQLGPIQSRTDLAVSLQPGRSLCGIAGH